jgi:hypothetical protein
MVTVAACRSANRPAMSYEPVAGATQRRAVLFGVPFLAPGAIRISSAGQVRV